MCGIAGFCISDADYGKIDTAAMVARLAELMEYRGKDATGVLTVNRRGRIELRKAKMKATDFIKARSGIGTAAQVALIHTRASTQGSPENPLNNHPIRVGDVFGIHNGMIHNDHTLYEKHGWDRAGQVDSEAIFAAIHHLPIPGDALGQIDGSYAIAWVDAAVNPHTLWLARGWQSPLYYAMTGTGSLVFASTKFAVEEAMERGGITVSKEKNFVVEAKEGWMGCIDPSGHLEHLPAFDYLGIEAPGGRPVRSTRHAAWDGDWDGYEDWQRASGQRNAYVNHPSTTQWPPGTLYSEVPAAAPTKHVKLGDTHNTYKTGVGWVREEYMIGGWRVVSIDGKPVTKGEANVVLALAAVHNDTTLRDDVEDDEGFFDYSLVGEYDGYAGPQLPYVTSVGATDKAAPGLDDKVAMNVRVSWEQNASHINLTGTVVALLEDGSYVVDWDPTELAPGLTHIRIESFTPAGA